MPPKASSHASGGANKGKNQPRSNSIEDQFADATKNSEVWLNTAGRGITPHNSIVAAEAAVREKQRPWLMQEEDETPLREVFSRLIPSALAEDISIGACASAHLSTIAWNLKEQWDNNVLYKSASATSSPKTRANTPAHLKPLTSMGSSGLSSGVKPLVLVVEEQYTSNVYPWQEILGGGEAGSTATASSSSPAGGSAATKNKGGLSSTSSSCTAEFLVCRAATEDDDLTESILSAYRQHKARVRLVALSQARWIDGRWIDLDRIVAELSPECAFVLDLTQSLGVVPVSTKIATRADAIVCTTHKWLLGLYGISLMYVNSKSDRVRHMTPVDAHERNRLGCVDGACLPFLGSAGGKTGEDESEVAEVTSLSPARFNVSGQRAKAAVSGKSLSDEARMSLVVHGGPPMKKPKLSPKREPRDYQIRPFSYEIHPGPLYEREFRAGSGLRVDMGGRPGNPVLLPALLQSLKLIVHEWTVDSIHAKCQQLSRQLLDEVNDLNAEIRKKSAAAGAARYLQVVYPKRHAPHLVGLKFAAFERGVRDGSVVISTDKAFSRLSQSQIYTSYRSGYIRVALYVYNTPADVARLVRCLKVYLFDALMIT